MSRGALLVVGLTLLAAAPAQAATRYADPNGNASSEETCPVTDPCDLETAVEHATVNDGDDILLASGTYTLANEVTVDNAIELIGAGPFASVIDSSATVALRLQPPGATVRNLGITASSTALGSVALVMTGASTGERLSVTGSGNGACDLDDQATLRDSVCASTNPSGSFAVLVDSTAGTPNLTLRNVTAYAVSPTANALRVFGDVTSVTVSVSNSIFQTPAGGEPDVIAGEDGTVSADVVLDHSRFADAVEFTDGSSVTDPGTATNIVAPALFANAAGGNLHQAAGSPTIDKGSSAASGLGTADIDGQARTQGANTDIGADEFVPAATVAAPPPPPARAYELPKKKCKKKKKKKGKSLAAAAKKKKKKKKC